MTQVSCISGWKTARVAFELTAPNIARLKQQHVTDPHYNYRVVFHYFGQLKGALVTCSDHAPLTHSFSFAASESTLYHTTCTLSDELSAADRAAIVNYLRDPSLGVRMLRIELELVQHIDRWLCEVDA